MPRIHVIGGLLLSVVFPLSAQTRQWSPDDRAIIGDFSWITAVAVSRDLVFAATPSAVVVWDPVRRHWRGPWQPQDPTLLRDVVAAIADPLDGGVWLIRRSGWLRFDPGIELWEQGSVPGGVLDAALDARDPISGLFLRTSSGWYQAQRGGFAVPGAAPATPVRAATVADAIRANPGIQANNSALVTNRGLGSVRFTAAARAQAFTGLGWFVGTAGAGILFYPEGAGLPERLTFGLPSDAVDAVFAGPGGVWAVTERTQLADPAFSFVSADFATFTWLTGPRATGLPFNQARRLVGLKSDLWIATDVGIVRVTPKSNDYVRYDEGKGLPDARVLDLAQRKGRLVAGTVHGLASFSDSGNFQRLAPDFSDAATAVELSGDTIWVGTPAGIFAGVPASTDLLQPDAVRASPAMQGTIQDFTWRADTLVALMKDRLLWRDPGTGRFTLGPVLGSGLGRMHTVVNGRGGLFIAGDRGIGFAGLGTVFRRIYVTPGDLPGQVTDIAVDDAYVWVATLAGLVRFRLDVVQ